MWVSWLHRDLHSIRLIREILPECGQQRTWELDEECFCVTYLKVYHVGPWTELINCSFRTREKHVKLVLEGFFAVVERDGEVCAPPNDELVGVNLSKIVWFLLLDSLLQSLDVTSELYFEKVAEGLAVVVDNEKPDYFGGHGVLLGQ